MKTRRLQVKPQARSAGKLRGRTRAAPLSCALAGSDRISLPWQPGPSGLGQAVAEMLQVRRVAVMHGREKALRLQLRLELANARHVRRRSRLIAQPAVARGKKSVLLAILGREPHEGLDGLRIVPADKMRPAEVAPEPR